MNYVKASCGCDISWHEWGGQGQEDAPHYGKYVYCPRHGDAYIISYDIPQVIANKLNLTRRELDALVSGWHDARGIKADLIADLQNRFPGITEELEFQPLGAVLMELGVLAPEQAAWLDDDDEDCPSPSNVTECETDAYLYLNETAHGHRFWRMGGDDDCGRLLPPDRTLAVLGPATIGPEGYPTEQDAAEALADQAGIDLDDPDTWDILL